MGEDLYQFHLAALRQLRGIEVAGVTAAGGAPEFAAKRLPDCNESMLFQKLNLLSGYRNLTFIISQL
jgi:hypothetical protein